MKLVWASLAAQADKEGWPAGRFLAALAEHEIAERSRRRLERHLAEARLPPGKTLDTFDFEAVPVVSKAQVMALAAGDAWLNNGANLLFFGPPGGGKSHLAAALGFALVEGGWRVLFTRTTDIVQRLQIARRELALEAAIAKLDKFHLLILDDLAYVTKDQAETSVLFELISARYERRSLLITANQPFGEWGKIFPDQAMTVAVVDRLVHHATIFEMNVESYRRRAALERKQAAAGRRSMRQSRPTPDCRAATLENLSRPLRDSYAATIMPLPRCQIPILIAVSFLSRLPRSAHSISAINQRLNARLAQFAGRPLAEAFPYLILDARYERVRGRRDRQPSGADRDRHRLGRPPPGAGGGAAQPREPIELARSSARARDRGLHGVEFVNDPAASRRVVDAFRRHFSTERVRETGPTPASEDFGSFGAEWHAPSVFWFVGGTDPERYAKAKERASSTRSRPITIRASLRSSIRPCRPASRR